jgi:hypothetical protein
MDYKDAWEEIKHWADEGNRYLLQLAVNYPINDCRNRIEGKADGLKILVDKMAEYERLINLK